MKRNQGITLIALVITIIVLLILAGVSISTLTGENGILTRATEAKEKNDIATLKEMIQTDTLEYQLENKSGNITSEQYRTVLDKYFQEVPTTAKELEQKLEDKEYSLKAKKEYGEYNIKIADMYEGDIETEEAKVGKKVTGKNKPYTNNGTAIIPVGFIIVPGCEDVAEGLVISDNEGDTELDPSNKVAKGNQFVWVPVDNFDSFERENGFSEGAKQSGEFVSNTFTEGKYYEPKGDGEKVEEGASVTVKEAQKMYKSVKDNGGFYIGRYEAGTTETDASKKGIRGEMVCKKEAIVYNAIGWSNVSNIETETGGAVEVARGFAKKQGYTSVTSTLCYGVQWDAVMRWMKGIDNTNVPGKKYIEDSTEMGWYGISNVKNTGTDIETGENNKSNKVKNIYDIAGNVWEWTMEAYSTNNRVRRGGGYSSDASNYPASSRYSVSPEGDAKNYGFRVALYL